jgi:hypothetical protein
VELSKLPKVNVYVIAPENLYFNFKIYNYEEKTSDECYEFFFIRNFGGDLPP